MLLIFFLTIFLLFFLPPIDTDLGWYLRLGGEFLSSGKITVHNNLTYYLANYYWANPYTLYEIIITLLFRIGGFWMLTLFYATLMVAVFWLFKKINQDLPRTSFFAFLLICFSGWHVFYLGIRSQIFSFALVVLLFWLMEKFEKDNRILLLLPLIFILWVNLHGGFILGFILLLTKALSLAAGADWKKSFSLTLAIIVSFLTTLINPYKFAVYKWSFSHFQVPMGTLIAEWVAPGFLTQALIFTSSLILVALVLASKSKKKIFWTGALSVFAILAIFARRNIPFFSLTFVLAATSIFRENLSALEKNKLFQRLSLSASVVGSIFLIILSLPKTIGFLTNWQTYCDEGLVRYPCAAVEFIKKNPLKGINVYSAYEWGGFLEWQLPQYKYFVDGRMPAWETPEGKSPYTVYLEIIQARPGYQERLDRYKTDWLLIGEGTFLDLELQQKKNSPWREIYRDEAAAIYTKNP